MSAPPVSILIPTRGRPAYLDVALASIAPQAAVAGAETLVVDDGVLGAATAAVAERYGARVITPGHRSDHPSRGANAARNAGVAASSGELVVLVDDDVRAPGGWLEQLLAGVARARDHDVFGGPIHAVLERGGPRSCGREGPPITHLDLGPDDRDVELVWSANMAIRRHALERIGPFDESLHGRGEEEEWERRYAATGGHIRYVARAGLEHRRTGADARLPALARADYALGRTARRYDVRKGTAPPAVRELELIGRCAVHVARRRCPLGIVSLAHAAGRAREALAS